MLLLSSFGGVFTGVKNNSKNFGGKNIRLFSSFKRSKIIQKVKIFNIYMCICIKMDYYDS